MAESVKIVIQGRFAGRNEHDKANRSSKYVGASLKKNEQKDVVSQMKQQCHRKFDRILVDFEWYEKDKRRDPDNVNSAVKVMLDALVECGIIDNDGWKQIVPDIRHRCYVDKDNQRVEINITDAGE